jgi:hypothetical protein
MCSGVGDTTQLVPGFPIRTSWDHSSVDSSPRPIAASHVLHRLLVPRHPPCALSNLTTKMLASTVQFSTNTHPHPPHHNNHPPNPTTGPPGAAFCGQSMGCHQENPAAHACFLRTQQGVLTPPPAPAGTRFHTPHGGSTTSTRTTPVTTSPVSPPSEHPHRHPRPVRGPHGHPPKRGDGAAP